MGDAFEEIPIPANLVISFEHEGLTINEEDNDVVELGERHSITIFAPASQVTTVTGMNNVTRARQAAEYEIIRRDWETARRPLLEIYRRAVIDGTWRDLEVIPSSTTAADTTNELDDMIAGLSVSDDRPRRGSFAERTAGTGKQARRTLQNLRLC